MSALLTRTINLNVLELGRRMFQVQGRFGRSRFVIIFRDAEESGRAQKMCRRS